MKQGKRSKGRARKAFSTVAKTTQSSVVLAPPASRGVKRKAHPASGSDESIYDRMAREQLAAIRAALRLSGDELAALFGVTRQAVDQWNHKSVPVEQAARADRLNEVITELTKRFKPQRLPAVVRAPMPILDNRSILQTLTGDGVAAIFEFFRRWGSYVPDVSPIRAGEFADERS